MKKILSITALFLCYTAIGQTYSWNGVYDGANNYKQLLKTITDNGNNVYICGIYTGTMDFDPGAGVDSYTSNGGQDIFLTKLDASGNYQWTKTFGGPKNEYIYDMAMKTTGLVLVGEFWDSVDFDPTAGTDNITSQGNTDVYLWNINFDGTYAGTYTIGGEGPDDIGSIFINSTGAIFLTGRYWFDVDFDLGAGTSTLTAASKCAMYVVKYDNAMNHVWSRSIENTPDRETLCIKEDNAGNIGIVGEYFNLVDFDPGPGNVSQATFNPQANYMFYLRLDSNGDFLNVGTHEIRLRNADFEYDINNVAHVVGTFIGEINVNGNNLVADSSAGFYFRIQPNQNVIGVPGYYEANGSIDAIRSIEPNSLGFVVLVNSEVGTGNSQPGMNMIQFGINQNLLSIGWNPNMGGNYLTADGNDDFIVVGEFNDQVDIQPGAGVVNMTSPTGRSGFVIKYN